MSIVGLAFGVNTGVPVGVGSLPVGGAFDDEGVCAGGEPVDGATGYVAVASAPCVRRPCQHGGEGRRPILHLSNVAQLWE